MSLDDGGTIKTAKEISRLLESLAKFQGRVTTYLRGFRAEHVTLESNKPALRAGHNVIRCRIPHRLELCASALRALNLSVAHKILKRGLPPNSIY